MSQFPWMRRARRGLHAVTLVPLEDELDTSKAPRHGHEEPSPALHAPLVAFHVALEDWLHEGTPEWERP